MKTRTLLRCLLLCGSIILALLATSIALANNAADGGSQNWPHFGYDDSYTAYNPIESTIAVTNVMELERRWGIGCDDDYFSVIFRSPAIHDGVLYTSGAGDRLRAYSARTGQKLWEFGEGNAGWAPQPVVSEDGVVYYMEETIPTYLYAVDGQSGAQLWKAALGFDLGYTGAAEAVVTVDEANGWVYLVEAPFMGGGKLFAIDRETGDVAWWMGEATHGAEFKGNFALLQGGEIYAVAVVPIPPSGQRDKMLRIDPGTQTIEMAYDRPEPENYWEIDAYTLCNEKLVTSFDYQYDPVKLVVAYDTYTSTIAWQKPLSQTVTGKIACNPDKNRIYVPTDPYLYALDAETGDEIWRYMGYGEIYNPSVANGIVYFLSDTNMYAIDEETKVKLLNYPLGYQADATTQVAIADGMLFFSGNGGTCDLFALGLPGEHRTYLPLLLRRWPPIPEAPTLYAISNPEDDGSYTVRWSAPSGATSYVLQEAAKATDPTAGDFTNVYSGCSTSHAISGRGAARYHYRVKARNSWGESGWSNMEHVDVLWEAEPNDDALTEANGPIVSGLRYYGTFPDPAEFDKDYYYFTLATPRTVDVYLTHIPAGQDYDLQLRDVNLDPPIYVSKNPGQADEHISTGVLPVGRYYIQVGHYDSGGSTQPYHLRAVYADGG